MTDDFVATVAICTHNGEPRLPRALESLAAQQDPGGSWEVLVIDNGSTDGTRKLCERWQEQLPVPLRVVAEPVLGLTHARRRAGLEARGRIVCFIDDDNLPAPDFVREAVQFFRTHPRAGVIGGRVKPLWESPPTPLALEVCDFALAVCDHGDEAYRYQGLAMGAVGAGLCVQRRLLQHVFEADAGRFLIQVTDRQGKHLVGGGDTALSVLARRYDYECWYAPALVLQHVIPARRMEPEYLLRLYDGIGRGQAHLRRLYDPRARRPVLATLIATKDFLRWLCARLRGPSAAEKTRGDIGITCHRLRCRQIWGRAAEALPVKR